MVLAQGVGEKEVRRNLGVVQRTSWSIFEVSGGK